MRRLSLLPFSLFLLLSLCGVARAAATDDDAQKYRADMDEGIAILRSGEDVSRAIAKFKSALKFRPESAEAYYWIALAYSDQNNYPRAAGNAKDATIYDERLAEAWLLWGQTLLYQKEWNEALQKLETAARLAPDDPLVLYNLGRVYYHGLKDPGAAYAKFNRIWQSSQTLRRENPANIPLVLRARLYMGYCEFERGQWAGAINAFLDVLREQPNNHEASLRLAIAYRKSDRAGECERILWDIRKALAAGNPAATQLLAEVDLQLADLYIKEPAVKNVMLAITHLQEFVNRIGNTAHPVLEPAREYLARNGRWIAETDGGKK